VRQSKGLPVSQTTLQRIDEAQSVRSEEAIAAIAAAVVLLERRLEVEAGDGEPVVIGDASALRSL
jgi:hypothetical protein